MNFILSITISLLFFLHLNNIKLFNPDYGFDGIAHQAYINWIVDNMSFPLPHQGWEFSQPPLYYMIGAIFQKVFINPQLINFVLLFLDIWLIYYFSRSKIAALAFTSLPMANYFPPLITNELLEATITIVSLGLLLQLSSPKEKLDRVIKILLPILTLGFYTKYTTLILLPLIPIALFLRTNSVVQTLKVTVPIIFVFLFSISPILYSNITHYHKPLVLAIDFFDFSTFRKVDKNLFFFTRLDWISRLDIFTARDYSFLGGLWNTFWQDGERVITPVVHFHKKAFILWLLGFPLLGLSFLGLCRHYESNYRSATILFSYVILAIISLVKYNLDLPFNFVVKSFYAFGLVFPYSIGLANAANSISKTRLITILLLIQFTTMLSYFWIQPWWHNVKLSYIINQV